MPRAEIRKIGFDLTGCICQFGCVRSRGGHAGEDVTSIIPRMDCNIYHIVQCGEEKIKHLAD